MADEVLDNETEQVTYPLKFRRNPYYLIWRELAGGAVEVIADESRDTVFRMQEMAMEVADAIVAQGVSSSNLRVAFIGAGTVWMPRIFNLAGWSKVDIYELRQKIIDKIGTEFPNHVPKWTFIVGDYVQTMTGTYHVIIYDLADPADMGVLNAHLAANGIIVGA